VHRDAPSISGKTVIFGIFMVRFSHMRGEDGKR